MSRNDETRRESRRKGSENEQLSGLGHGIPVHEVRGLDLLESPGPEVVESVVDESLVEIDTVSSQEETSVSSDFGSCRSRREEKEGRKRAVREKIVSLCTRYS